MTEIWIFGAVGWLLLQWPDCGHIAIGGAASGPPVLLDSVYMSAITYTTVGFGDVVPVGPIRFLSGMEALTGFVLIGVVYVSGNGALLAARVSPCAGRSAAAQGACGYGTAGRVVPVLSFR